MPSYSDTVRALPFPVLEDGNLSFVEGEYLPEITSNEDGCSVVIEHKVTNAPLIKKFVKEGKAVCCCVVSIPKTGYRELFIGDGFNQEVKWDESWVGEPPIICPSIVCKKSFNHEFCKKDGIHKMWIGRKIRFHIGARIALGPHFRPISSLQSLLSIDSDKSLKPGQLCVDPCIENGFYFTVKVAEDLYTFLQNPGSSENKHRFSILVHIVSSCLAILARDYSSEDEQDHWQSYSNLRALASEMESKNISVWYEDNFRPEEAATALYPHPIPDLEYDGRDV